MYYRLSDRVALRKWKYVDRALYVKEMEVAVGVPKEGFPFLFFVTASMILSQIQY